MISSSDWEVFVLAFGIALWVGCDLGPALVLGAGVKIVVSAVANFITYLHIGREAAKSRNPAIKS